MVEQVHESAQAIMTSVAKRSNPTPLGRPDAYVQEQPVFNARNLRRISVYYQDRAGLSAARSAEIRCTQESYVVRLIEEPATDRAGGRLRDVVEDQGLVRVGELKPIPKAHLKLSALGFFDSESSNVLRAEQGCELR
jgi:hypothetical protein